MIRAVEKSAVTVVAPLVTGLLVLGAWEWLVRARGIEPFVLPGPLLVGRTLVQDLDTLLPSLLFTLEVAAKALLAAAVLGVLLAVLMAQSRWIAASVYPWAVALQVTPIVAIAPLLIIYFNDDVPTALLVCAFVVAFFPVVSNTSAGLASVDRDLADLFRLYGASRTQTLWRLHAPSALPYFLAGLRISGGLSLIGAVVAEFVAGTGGAETGLAYRILEAGLQLRIPRMYAALVLLALAGVAIFGLLSLLSHHLLRHWHPSARA